MKNVRLIATKAAVVAARPTATPVNPIVARAASIMRRVARGMSYAEAVQAYDANQKRIAAALKK